MADVVLGVAGGIVGSFYGNWQGGMAIGMMIGGILFPPDLGTAEVGRIDDFKVQGMSQGSPIPKVWGKYRLAGQIIWSDNIREHVSTSSTGGGSGGGGSTTKTYSYTTTFALLVCAGEIDHFEKIWANNEVIYDYNSGTPIWADWINPDKVTFYFGTESQTADPTMEAVIGAGLVPAYRGVSYIVFEDMKAPNGNIANIHVLPVTAIKTVEDVLTDICADRGFDASEYDFSNMSAYEVRGMCLPNRIPARNAIELLSTAYFFDITEYDGKVRSKIQGESSLDTLDTDWIGVETNSFPKGDRIVTSRQQEIELPKSITVTYVSEANDYQAYSQSASRLSSKSEEEKTIQLPLVFTEDEARTIAGKALYVSVIQRNMHSFNLSYRDLDKCPGDIVVLPTDLGNKRIKIIDMTMALLGHIKIVAVEDSEYAYIQDYTGGTPVGGGGTVNNTGDTIFEVADINATRDADADYIGYYAAVACAGTKWPGAVIEVDEELSPLDGDNDEQYPFDFENQCLMGFATIVLDEGTPYIWDEVSTVRVELVRGTLETAATDLEVLNGKNWAVLGQEIFAFRTATFISGTVWELSGLLRGLRGTEYAISSHDVGDTFILITNACQRDNVKWQYLGETFGFRALQNDKHYDPMPSFVDDQLVGRSRMPYSPAHFEGTYDGDDLDLEWVRRVRKDGELVDYYDAPLDEDTEEYKVYIYDDNTFTTIARTIDITSATTTIYTAAQQTTDFGGIQTTIYAGVVQISTIVGPGFETRGTFVK